MKVSTDGHATPELEQYRDYLKLLADLQLNPRLRAKEDASDIVQQTMLDAHLGFADFRGKTDAELRAWLKMILTHNLLAVARRYGTHKRAVGREVTLQDQLEQSSALLHQRLVADQTSPSMTLMKRERSEQLADALLNLLDDERSAVVLKHYHNWSVAEIAQHLGRTQDAVAGLLRRGLKKLREHLREKD
jgi:RNA polymerase sigma-70 factor, ECF subfamily